MSQKLKDFDHDKKGGHEAPTGQRNVTLMTDLIRRAEAMSTDVAASIDPRRAKEILYQKGDIKNYLLIDGTMWAEVQWSPQRSAWCIQDCMGYCLEHIEHFHVQVDGDPNNRLASRQQALDLAEQMIRDGRMPSPEKAREAFQKRNP